MKLRRVFTLVILMIVGEFIFLLPFVLTRVFRPTFLKVFQISNFELGSSFSVYGIVAMLAYFAGGPLADRYSPRQLLPFSILLTAAGGVFLSFIPSIVMLTVLYGFWGITTILLFWASYVKAQRELGGAQTQGRSFGMIDAGRGLVAAIVASSSVFILDAFLPVNADEASLVQLSGALSGVILIFSGCTALSAGLVWLFVSDKDFENASLPRISLEGIKIALKRRSVWMQAMIVLCAYVGYKAGDDFSLYATLALGYNDVEAAQMTGIIFWIRPLAAITAGLLGDRFLHSKMIAVCFLFIVGGSLWLSFGEFEAGAELFVVMTIASVAVGIYGLRGLYFALFQESKLPLVVTGSAAGFVSLIGYTPDVFMGPVMGFLLDNSPGLEGHQQFFAFVALFAVIGFFTAFFFKKSY